MCRSCLHDIDTARLKDALPRINDWLRDVDELFEMGWIYEGENPKVMEHARMAASQATNTMMIPQAVDRQNLGDTSLNFRASVAEGLASPY